MTGPVAQQAREATEAALAALRPRGPHGVAEVERVRGMAAQPPAVVVVGEAKRGKSSLVNALLAAPDLAPVDARASLSSSLPLHAPRHLSLLFVARLGGGGIPPSLR